MTERGKAVFDRLVRECNEQKSVYKQSHDARIRLRLTIPLDESFWESKPYNQCDAEPWTVSAMNKEYHFLRDKVSRQGERERDMVEFFFVSMNDLYNGNIIAVGGTIDASQFRHDERCQDVENYLKSENELSDDLSLSAQTVVSLHFQSLGDYLSDSMVVYSFDSIYPQLDDCFVTEKQLSKMMKALNCDEERIGKSTIKSQLKVEGRAMVIQEERE